jgi:hypothetical protein
MASPINPEEEKNSIATVVEVPHDLRNEQVHKLTGEQYRTEKYESISAISQYEHKTQCNEKVNKKKGVQVLHQSREEELHLRYFIISFSKTRTQLGLFQVLQRKINHFSFFLFKRRKTSQRVSNKDEQNKYIL